jgi:hypothetical protein
MKRWGLLVVGLYGLLILIFTLPLLSVAFIELKQGLRFGVDKPLQVFASWPYWAGVIVFLIAQAALLDVHVLMAQRRPVTKRTVVPLIALSALMMALLMIGMAMSAYETITRNPEIKSWLVLPLLPASWCIWGFIFYQWSKNPDTSAFLGRVRESLFRGSILELLVAVPTHILARSRDYCCAGFNTFIGIVFGLAVMFCSFGPGVFFLFAERWRKLHPNK